MLSYLHSAADFQMAYEAVHEIPTGPGDARPTALDIVQDQDLVGKLAGKTMLVTGGTSGLGFEAVRALYVSKPTGLERRY